MRERLKRSSLRKLPKSSLSRSLLALSYPREHLRPLQDVHRLLITNQWEPYHGAQTQKDSWLLVGSQRSNIKHHANKTRKGYMRVYQAPGSVNFINSRDMLKPLLPKTQCWCVDGESKFVLLRMGISNSNSNTYWRIELPNKTPDEKGVVEDFIRVLREILQYEKTPCPFKREHTVELPENLTPVKLRPWKPKPRPVSYSGDGLPSPENFERRAAARRASYFRDRKVVLSSPEETPTEEELGGSSSGSSVLNLPLDLSSSVSGESRNDEIPQFIDECLKQQAADAPANLPDPFMTLTKQATASIKGNTASTPPDLALSTVGSQTNIPPVAKSTASSTIDTASIASSIESFHSFQSFHDPSSPITSSPCSSPSSSPTSLGIDMPRTRKHRRDASKLTIMTNEDSSTPEPETSDMPEWFADDTSTPTCPKTPPLTSDSGSEKDENWSDAVTPSPPSTFRRRMNTSRQRVHSPLLSPANLYSPQSRLSGHHLTTALLQKTCSLLLGPPVQLVALMLNIAARIRNGTFGLENYSDGARGRIPGTWDYSDEEDGSRDLWDEDDFGISLKPDAPKRPRSVSPQSMYGSWEID